MFTYDDAVEMSEMDAETDALIALYGYENENAVSDDDVQWNGLHRYFACPSCDGTGFHYREPLGWWHGSGVFGEEQSCRTCDETGEGPDSPVDGITGARHWFARLGQIHCGIL